MPRVYKRKTDKGLIPLDVMKQAVAAVKGGQSTQSVAIEFGIPRITLNNNVLKSSSTTELGPNYKHSLVFTAPQEASLADYLEKCSNMFYGLTLANVKSLVFEMAKVNHTKVPKSWEDKKAAGKDWLNGFRSRHPNLTLRQTESTSLARATAFNAVNVDKFFSNLETVIKANNLSGGQIFNLDETGLTTVQRAPKVLAPKGLKQVGQIASRERGELVTLCAIISVMGQCLPPVFLFPRKNYRPCFLNGAPEGSLGLTSSSGWMTSEIFVTVMQHVVKHVRPSKEFPIALVMDNHESHLSFEALSLAKEKVIHVVTLPPHTSNKTQPLDRTVFGPLKTAFNTVADAWMMKNVGRPIIYEIAELGGEALVKAATPANNVSRFRATGIWLMVNRQGREHRVLEVRNGGGQQQSDAINLGDRVKLKLNKVGKSTIVGPTIFKVVGLPLHTGGLFTIERQDGRAGTRRVSGSQIRPCIPEDPPRPSNQPSAVSRAISIR